MNGRFALLADYADEEFDGASYNGASLVATLSSLEAAQAAADSSYEGYSAWSVALHIAYCKWCVAGGLLDESDRAALGPCPYPKGGGGFATPPDASAAAWTAFLAYLSDLHRTCMRALRESGDDLFERELTAWKIPLGKAVVWLCSHDTYHTAQIRNMGIPSLRDKRVY